MKSFALSPLTAKGTRLVLGVILLVAFALRLWGVDQHNIWWDEGFTTWMSRLPVPQMLERTAHDTHPPLSYLMQHGWWLLTGEGEWPMRFVSVFAGTLAVAVLFAVGRHLGGPRAGLLAAAFLALSVFAITWSQEIRMYAWVSVWGLLTLYASLRVWSMPRLKWYVLYVVATAAGLFTLYLSAIVPLVANLAFVVFWWRAGGILSGVQRSRRTPPAPQLESVPRDTRSLRTLGRWVLAQVAVLAVLAPWLAYTLPRMPRWSAAEPYSAGFFARLYATVLATGMGENIDEWLVPAVLVLLVALACTAALVARRKSAVQSGGLAMLVFAVLLPPALVYALTAFPGRQPYVPPLSPRYFLPLAAAFSALLGWGLAELSSRKPTWFGRALALSGAGIVSAVAVASVLVVVPGRVASDQYASLAAALVAHEHPGDKVLLYPDQDWPLFAAKYPGPWEKAPSGMDFTPEAVESLLRPVWESSEGLWVVTTPKAQEADHDGLVHEWLGVQAGARADWDFGETKLTLYARTPGRATALYDLRPDFTLPATWGEQLAATGGELFAPRLPLRRYQIGDALYALLYWPAAPSDGLSLGLREVPAPQQLLDPPMPVTQGLRSTLARLPLTPDLAPGRYHVVLRDDGREVAELGAIDLVRARARETAAGDPQYRLDLRLGEHVRLLGFDLPSQAAVPGEFVELALYWQTDAVLTERYKVFTHLIGQTWNADGGNFLWGQQDNEPQAGQLPTTQWPPGEVIVDRYRVKVDPNAPAGAYQVEVGMYGLMDGARLPLSTGGDAVVVGEVEVK